MINLLQTIKTKDYSFKVIDFNKLSKLKYIMNIIISQRGKMGKTYNAKEFILDEWFKFKKKSGWILNTQIQWNEMYFEFINLNKKNNFEKWKNVIVKSNGLYFKKERFCYFLSISAAGRLKSGRNTLDYLFYDEFNECLEMVRKKQVDNLYSLWFTYGNPVLDFYPQLFIFGNQKSLANNLLEKLEIIKLEKELTLNDNLGLLLYVPYVQELDSINSKSIMNKKFINLAKKIGVYEKDMKNINTIDNTWGIINKKEFDEKKWIKDKNILKSETRYYNVYRNNYDEWYIKLIDKPEKNTSIVFSKIKNIEHGIIFLNVLNDFFLNIIQNKKLYFDSISTKLDILEMIT